MLAPILKGNRKHDFIHQVEEHGRRKKGLSGEYEKIPIQSKLCVSYTLYSKDRYKSLIQNIHIQRKGEVCHK